MANKLVSYFRSKAGVKPKNKIEVEAPFKGADGMRYQAFFEQLHSRYLFDWYMEIGCRTGAVLSHARGKAIAVDPFFKVIQNVIGGKPAMHVFQAKSDDFFGSGFLQKNEIALSVSFLDGMHLFEYLLRDFINSERHSHPDGVILMHDCCPRNLAMTTRDLDNLPEGAWTGDVWKLLPILQKYRPDLRITVLNCTSTGLVVVSGLAPGNGILSQNYDAIIKAYVDLDLEKFGVEAFFASFTFTDAQAFLDIGAPMFANIAMDAVQVQTPVFISP